jgi:hypothetical protein
VRAERDWQLVMSDKLTSCCQSSERNCTMNNLASKDKQPMSLEVCIVASTVGKLLAEHSAG